MTHYKQYIYYIKIMMTKWGMQTSGKNILKKVIVKQEMEACMRVEPGNTNMSNRMKVSSRYWESKSSVQWWSVSGIRLISRESRGEHHIFPLALDWFSPKANFRVRKRKKKQNFAPLLEVKRLFVQIWRLFVSQQHLHQLPLTKDASMVGIWRCCVWNWDIREEVTGRNLITDWCDVEDWGTEDRLGFYWKANQE